MYRRLQAIVEHPYGTIKRQWGFSYILTKKGKERAGADVGFMLIAYNLRRIGNILSRDVLKEYLRILLSLFLGILGHLEAVLRIFSGIDIPALVFVKAEYHPGKLRKIDLDEVFTKVTGRFLDRLPLYVILEKDSPK